MLGAAMTVSASAASSTNQKSDFNYVNDRFADIEVLRYKVPGFEQLSLQQKKLIYYLTEAAITGRDILWDQNGKYNLAIRSLLENVYTNYSGSKKDKDYKGLELYLKQIWFGNGIHHHYSMDKFKPEFSEKFLRNQIAKLPADKKPADTDILLKVIFDPQFMAKRVNQAEGEDLILTSANNLYDGVTQAEVEAYYNALKDTTDLTPVSYGLNTRVTKINGKVTEQPYMVGGLYSPAITRIVELLGKARECAENPAQAATIDKLIEFYRTGSLKAFDEYSIMWVDDTNSQVDFINGFIESYGDPLGMTGSWESIVNFKNIPASHRTEVISDNAQWFESNSPVDPRFRKDKVKGVTAKVITAAILAGDSYPSTPIGINLPNANWIRAAHGSTLEEARADLFALYYLADPKLLELGLLDNADAYKPQYYKYILNGLMTQLMRIEPGKDVEEAHMRNRKLISEWVLEKGKKDNVMELYTKDGKTYLRINDYPAVRRLFGELLGEIQRIKSEGDYEAGRDLVEKYAVKVDPKLHNEVLERYSHLNIAPYKGFVNPVYTPVYDQNGNITDVTISYTEDYIPQMLRYSRDYSPLTK